MSEIIDREGTFRATIIEYGLKEQKSGAVALTIKARLLEMFDFDSKEWQPWADYNMEAYGDLYIVKTDGTLNKSQVNSIIQATGWDGNFASLSEGTWEPPDCQVVIQPNEYNGHTSYKISFVNDFNRTPGQLSNIDANKAKTLQAKFGGELRALAGNAKRNSAPAENKPASPPKRQPAGVAGNGTKTDGDIPFALLPFVIGLASLFGC